MEDDKNLRAAKIITEIFGGHPFALRHAIGWMHSIPMTLQQFADTPELRAMSFNVLERYQGVAPNFMYRDIFATALNKSLAKIVGNPEVAELLEVLVLLDPDCIVEELIKSGARNLPPGSLPCLQQSDKYFQAIQILRSHSFVTRNPKRGEVTIHRLVQWATTRRWSPDFWRRAFDRVKMLLISLLPKQIQGQSLTVGEDLIKCRSTAMHVTFLESRYREFKTQIDVGIDFAELLANLGYYLFERGQHQPALEVLASAREICQKEFGPEGMKPNLITALVLNNISAVISARGEAYESRALKQLVVDYRRQLLPRNDPNLGNALNNLATAYYDIDELLEAEKHF